MSIEALSAQPALIDRVHDRLLAAIVDGTLAPGHRITQEEIAAQLGVSRQPVSHALQILRRRGLVQDAGKRGLVVAPLDARRLRNLYEVRAVLEGLAASLAAGRARNGQLSRAERETFSALVADGSALAGGDAPIGALIEADVAFHSALHRLSGNDAIAETVAAEWPHFMRSMGVVLQEPSMRVRAWEEHGRILEAVLGGDSSRAEGTAREHANRAGAETAERLERQHAVA